MTHQLTALTHYLSARGRRYRFTPVTELPTAERFTQIERLIDALWDTSRSLGFNLGQKPTIIYTGESLLVPSDLLRHLTTLEVETLATFLVVGLGSAYARSLHDTCAVTPAKPSVSYKMILDETFPSV